MNDKLGVFIYYEDGLKDFNLLNSIGYGVEEEGIPFIIRRSKVQDFRSLAKLASEESQLDVGIGLDASGNVCIHHAKLPENNYLFISNLVKNTKDSRIIGSNGARLVKGIPFKTIVNSFDRR